MYDVGGVSTSGRTGITVLTQGQLQLVRRHRERQSARISSSFLDERDRRDSLGTKSKLHVSPTQDFPIVVATRMQPTGGVRPSGRSSIQHVANTALKSASVEVEKLDGYIYSTYRLRTSEKSFYILRSRPSSNVRLLRHEESWLESEAGALQDLARRSDTSPGPRLLQYHNTRLHIGSLYLISGPFTGTPLSSLPASFLTRASLARIDKKLGQYVRQLSTINGSHFGSLQRMHAFSSGLPSWSRAFAVTVESTIRDGEDALISLPYDGIRALVRRHRHALEKVTQPRLTLIELAANGRRNLVLDPVDLRVTGLLDWSTAIWGDPLLSDCFIGPTKEFLEGFGEGAVDSSASEDGKIRKQLYIMYHSLLAIVRQCYRPSSGAGDEMEARRNLTAAIRHLHSLDGNGE